MSGGDGELFEITKADKLACINREVRMREKAYPKWVKAGRMTQEKATREISVMKAIAEDYMADK